MKTFIHCPKAELLAVPFKRPVKRGPKASEEPSAIATLADGGIRNEANFTLLLLGVRERANERLREG